MFPRALAKLPLLAGLALIGTATLAAEPMRLVIPEYAPYTSTAGGKPHGIGVDKVVPLLTALGIESKISGGSFGDAVTAIKEGRADGFFLASQNSERDAVAILFAPIVFNNWFWYLAADSKLDPKGADFNRATIVGTVSFSAQAAWLNKNDFHVRIVPTADSLPGMLLEHKGINSILGPELVINDAIAKAGLTPDKFRSVLADRKPFGLYVAKTWLNAHPEMAGKLKAAVAALNP